MELRQRYAIFVRIVETGSMGRAALDLNIGVSALSQQMARLENELAIRLLQRTSRVMPTRRPRSLLLAGATALCAMLTMPFSPRVKHAFPVTSASVWRRVPLLCWAYLLSTPCAKATPTSACTGGKPLRQSGTDDQHSPARFSHRFPEREDPALERLTILEERLFLIGAMTCLRCCPAIASPDQLAAIPLIMPSQGHGLRGRLDAICQEHAINVDVVAEIDGLALLMRAVRDGLGATLQPGAAISHLDSEALRVIGVDNPVLSRPNFWSVSQMTNLPRKQALRHG